MTFTLKGIGTEHPDVGRIFGSYRVLALLGEGGMGLVYLAEHVRLGRQVALKRLKDRHASKPETVRKFFEEARAVNRINHPNIVEITDFVERQDSAYYIMEFLSGRSLAHVMMADGILEVRRALHVAHQVADALSAAHSVGIIHLDIKPSNIFLIKKDGHEDFVKLLDFGIAQLAKLEASEESRQAPGPQALGTPVYMSPEQFRGVQVDHRSDIYSLGVVMYEMLAGEPPFSAKSTAEYAYKHMNVKPVGLGRIKGLPREIARACGQMVAKCLEKDPDQRYGSCEELMADLELSALKVGVALRPKVPPVEVRTSSWGRKAVIAGIVSAALLIAGFIGYLLLFGTGDKAASKEKGTEAKPRNGRVAASSAHGPDGGPGSMKKNVTLRIQTDPSGAMVIRTSPERKILGLTPLITTVPFAPKTWKMEIKKEGCTTKEASLRPDRDNALSISLHCPGIDKPASQGSADAGVPDDRTGDARRRRRRRDARRKDRTRPGDADRTVDPFGRKR